MAQLPGYLKNPKIRVRFEQLWLDMSVTVAELSAELGISPSVAVRWRKIMGLPSRNQLAGRVRPDAGVVKTTRPACLKCGGDFESDGAGHRVCNHCKHSADWRAGDGFAEDYTVVGVDL